MPDVHTYILQGNLKIKMFWLCSCYLPDTPGVPEGIVTWTKSCHA